MTKLSVNVNKIALLRNQRDLTIPSVVGLSRVALEAGAFGITVHPRPDERHIRKADVPEVAALLREWPDREFNIEGNPLDFGGGHLMHILRANRPTQATLVPDDPTQNTSDHGFPLTDPSMVATLRPIVAELKELGCRVSLFVDPDPETAKRAADCGADRIELYTETFARAFGTPDEQRVLDAFIATAEAAASEGLVINAGHDLNLQNLPRFLEVPAVAEVSIGHALVADALTMGMEGAVRAYLDAIG
ncbi:MAG: pyridoxine 5'-phosphate synthase [Deltaproteobacteria bacterium]|nr:pyridoxine 5'-phosphate synthase [Deltaproteobacteria bacterium]